MPVSIDDSGLGEFRRELECVIKNLPPTLFELAKRGDVRISSIAISHYMQDGDPEGRRSPDDTGPLYIRRGGIARALTGSTSQGQGTRFRAQGRGKIFSATIRAGVLEMIKGIQPDVVPYAAIQELGGTISMTVTDRQNKFFWAKWYETKEPMWRAMGIKYRAGTTLTIEIPPRPYLGPALEDALPYIAQQGEKLLFELFTACFDTTN